MFFQHPCFWCMGHYWSYYWASEFSLYKTYWFSDSNCVGQREGKIPWRCRHRRRIILQIMKNSRITNTSGSFAAFFPLVVNSVNASQKMTWVFNPRLSFLRSNRFTADRHLDILSGTTYSRCVRCRYSTYIVEHARCPTVSVASTSCFQCNSLCHTDFYFGLSAFVTENTFCLSWKGQLFPEVLQVCRSPYNCLLFLSDFNHWICPQILLKNSLFRMSQNT